MMKFTLDWLKDHLETTESVETLCAVLTQQGLEVEQWVDIGARLESFVIAEVTQCRKHPESDHLKLCVVNDGQAQHQVVCGAPNAKQGMKGVFASTGVYIPGIDLTLKATKIRGEMSHGMLCSKKELCISDEHEGIIELASDAPVGENYASWAGLKDVVIEIAVTPNRGDCLSVHGIARDLAAAGIGRLKPLAEVTLACKGASPFGWRIDLPQQQKHHCPFVAGVYLRGIDNTGPAPDWMRQRLTAIGVRPISALVDVTNYITFDLGRPLHVFDADRLTGDSLVMCKSKTSERIDALNDKSYETDASMTVIKDGKAAVSIAGIMGGIATGCTHETENVFMEAALFDAIDIARTGRTLNIQSDARYRFERHVDPQSVTEGLQRAAALMLEICGGEASEIVTAGEIPNETRSIEFDTALLKSFGGVGIDIGEAQKILQGLGFTCAAKDKILHVQVPSFRPDVTYPQCLVEEVLRIYGYDNIPPLSLPKERAVTPSIVTPKQKRVNYLRRALCARGLNEAYSWSFCDSRKAREFWSEDAAPEMLMLQNPISSALDVMRPSVLVTLLAAVQENHARKIKDIAVFEVGPAFANPSPEGQSLVCAGVRSGRLHAQDWQGGTAQSGVYDVKADVEAALEAIGIATDKLVIMPDAPGHYHPGRSGSLMMGKQPVAHFGEIHPKAQAHNDLRESVVMFEILLDNLPEPKQKKKTRPQLKISPHQPVERDFAFVLDRDIPAQTLVQALKKAEKKYLTDIKIFDCYQDSALGAHKKSLALTVTLQPQTQSFTDEDLTAVTDNIIRTAATVGAVLRTS